MTGLWGDVSLPVVGKPGTPVLFDAGVYLTVLGVVLLILSGIVGGLTMSSWGGFKNKTHTMILSGMVIAVLLGAAT